MQCALCDSAAMDDDDDDDEADGANGVKRGHLLQRFSCESDYYTHFFGRKSSNLGCSLK